MLIQRQAFVGSKIFLPRNMLKKLPDGEYYWRDIIGLDVYSEEEKYIGKIESVFPQAAMMFMFAREKKKRYFSQLLPM